MVSGVTYQAWFDNHTGWAVGSTLMHLSSRRAGYLRDAARGHIQTPLYKLIVQLGADAFHLTEIDRYDDITLEELRAEEQALMDKYKNTNCLNTRAAQGGDDTATRSARTRLKYRNDEDYKARRREHSKTDRVKRKEAIAAAAKKKREYDKAASKMPPSEHCQPGC